MFQIRPGLSGWRAVLGSDPLVFQLAFGSRARLGSDPVGFGALGKHRWQLGMWDGSGSSSSSSTLVCAPLQLVCANNSKRQTHLSPRRTSRLSPPITAGNTAVCTHLACTRARTCDCCVGAHTQRSGSESLVKVVSGPGPVPTVTMHIDRDGRAHRWVTGSGPRRATPGAQASPQAHCRSAAGA